MIAATISAIAFLPYALVMYIAFKKGYPRLFLLIVAAVTIGIINIVFNPSSQFKDIERMVFSFVLLLHALDLKPRNQRG